ncbi:hypothetical protein HYPSUDRAFT_39010 [Hypholoma sublateritium FD-334 SS-4]|uniref:Uncharacterized protein n=1 Tax=Hypholoma sublateritium (strain FD-334 SS-4) TaxID=945553 RepID=A0A0D2MKK8_HYPSF|nr:hypothetical protein HYPSUDRAFT_39010 [Hypholoma sublateritium FD-334 SS-4]
MGYSPERAASPLHFLHPALFHPAAPAKRRSASDVARLLDPSYLPAADAKTRRSASVSAYVDPAGDMHDPDYRHFPVAHSPRAPRTQPGARRTTSPRPHFDWERTLDESALDDEYPALPHYNYRPPPARSASPIHTPPRPRGASVSTTTTARSAAAGSPATGSSSSPPTSFEDESPFADDSAAQARFAEEMARERALQLELASGKERREEKKRRRRLSREAEKASVRRASCDEAPKAPAEPEEEHQIAEEEEEQDAEEESRIVHRTSPTLDFVPSCTHSLKRQWQALALSVRFGVFRARRRLTRRVQSLL